LCGFPRINFPNPLARIAPKLDTLSYKEWERRVPIKGAKSCPEREKMAGDPKQKREEAYQD